MDQTDFSLLVGVLAGSHAGAFGLQSFTGWSLWVTYPIGGLVGLVLFAAATFLIIECVGRLIDRRGRKE
jgi:hypothetical protein